MAAISMLCKGALAINSVIFKHLDVNMQNRNEKNERRCFDKILKTE